MDVFARRRLVAVLAIVLALILIGVAIAGGGDDEGAPITTVTGASIPGLAEPLTKDEFIEQSDGICEEAAVSIANLSGDDPEQLAEDELALTEAELDSLRSLAPPEQDQATLDDFFSALEDLAAALDKQLLALQRSDDNAASQADTEIATAEADVLAAAEDYGFKECGTDAESSADPGGEPTAPTDPGAVAPTTPPATTPPATTPPATTPPATPPADGGGGGGGGGTGSGGISP